MRAAFVPDTFFNATHQAKAIVIGVSEVNPLGESVDCSTPLHSTRILNQFIGLYFLKEISPYTHFYIALFCQFSYKSGSLLTCPVFSFEIDHDDGTKKHILSHLETT